MLSKGRKVLFFYFLKITKLTMDLWYNMVSF